MKNRNKVIWVALILLVASATGRIWDVCCPQSIQEVIDNQQVQDGDTLSLWGEPGSSPPYIFYGCIDLHGKALKLGKGQVLLHTDSAVVPFGGGMDWLSDTGSGFLVLGF
ncbi:MAG: hypothetical protein ABIK23_02890 [candidate division WOR-3 bacterium]